MNADCRSGKWSFHIDPEANDLGWKHGAPTYRFKDQPVAPFWIENESGVRVSRSTVYQRGEVHFYYYTEDYCLSFLTLIVNTDNIYGMRLIESGEMEVLDHCPIFIWYDDIWVNAIGVEEYNNFIDDVLELGMYSTLFLCMPASWSKSESPYRAWSTKLYKPIENLVFSAPGLPFDDRPNGRQGAEACFRAIDTMAKAKVWWPKSSQSAMDIRFVNKLREGLIPDPVQQTAGWMTCSKDDASLSL